jgi:hypothetical protein
MRTDPSVFPRPMCATCAEQSACRARGRVENDYPNCHCPLLRTSLRTVTSLLSWWSRFHDCSSDSRLDEVGRTLMARFTKDRMRFSEVFEPSWSHDEAGWHFWRFSYAFPGHCSDPAADIGSLVELCRPFGEAVAQWVRSLSAHARDPAVFLPLVGLAYDTPASWRVKLYLQFRDDAGDASLRIAARLTGREDLHRMFRNRTLHMVGIDLGPHGISGAKLYFLEPCIPWRDVSRVAGPVDLIEYLGNMGVDPLHNLLVIHRMRRQDDPDLDIPTEIDFALRENELCWEDLAGFPIVSRLRRAGGPAAELESAFSLGVRRISVPVGRTDKLNVYYVLTEIDAP